MTEGQSFLLAVPVSFLLMEGVAYTSHRFLMHGPLWFLHRSHHEVRRGLFEWNDLFGVFFSLLSIGFFLVGLHFHRMYLGVGLGMTLYGAGYFFLHDVLVHRRLKHGLKPAHPYLKRLIRAHHVHHAKRTRGGCEAFGFLYAPSRYGRTGLPGPKLAESGPPCPEAPSSSSSSSPSPP